MKNVIIIGANGRSARQAIPHIQAQPDVALTLFARRQEQLNDVASDSTVLVEGDARDRGALTRALAGQDIVIVALGGDDLDETTAAVVDAARTAGTPRIITINAGGIYDELPEPFNTWDRGMVGSARVISRRAADAVEQSVLAYTILRPVWLTDKDVLDVQVTRKGQTFKGTETSRASVGKFIADIVADPDTYVNESVGISQPDTDGDKPAAYR